MKNAVLLSVAVGATVEVDQVVAVIGEAGEEVAATALQCRVIVELIAATTTKTGLTVAAAYDPSWYPTGIKINNTQFASIPSPDTTGTVTGTTPSHPPERATYPAADPNDPPQIKSRVIVLGCGVDRCRCEGVL